MDPATTMGEWHLSGVIKWQADQEGSYGVSIPDQTLPLPMIPEELTHFGVPGFYLATEPLRALSKAHKGSTAQIWANVALWRRATIVLTPFTVGALALCLVRLGFVGRLLIVSRLIGFGTAGYICVVALKVFYTTGEIGGLSAAMATLGPLALLLAISAFLTWRAS